MKANTPVPMYLFLSDSLGYEGDLNVFRNESHVLNSYQQRMRGSSLSTSPVVVVSK